DLDWLEVQPSIGIAIFSSDYRTNPAAALSIMAHAPMPWLSLSSNPNGEYFGLFAQASFFTIDRDLSPVVDHRKRVASFFTLGLDYSFLRDDTWIIVARAGGLYAYYGDIADLSSGFGFTLGATLGVQLSSRIGLTYNPDFFFGDSGSLIVLNTVGLLIHF